MTEDAMRVNGNEPERVAALITPRREEEAHAHDHGAADADARALRAVAGGSVHSLDHGGIRSLQRLAGNAGVAAALQREEGEGGGKSPVLDVIGRGGGSPLDRGTKSFFESSYGHDFSDVRVHSDGAAQQSAAAVQAHAYTVGNEIVLGNGVDPGSDSGKRTLAHELTHVVQQREGPVDGTSTGDGVQISDPSDRFEQAAERNADAVMSGSKPELASSGGGGGGPTAQREDKDQLQEQALSTVQRAGDNDQEPVVEQQALSTVQRAQVPDENETVPGQSEEDVRAQALHIQREVKNPEEEITS